MNAYAQQPRRKPFELSDTEIACMAQAALGWNSNLPRGAIRADASAGWVTLSGEVSWHFQRQDAENCVRDLPGVEGVSNDISLRPSTGTGIRAEP